MKGKAKQGKLLRCDQCSFTAEYHKTEMSRNKADKRMKNHKANKH